MRVAMCRTLILVVRMAFSRCMIFLKEPPPTCWINWRKMKYNALICLAVVIFTACEKKNMPKQEQLPVLSPQARHIRDQVPAGAVIAHRGTTYWAPEETEAAYRWARNMGADYLELDLQMTRDSVLVAVHDNDLQRTTNITEVFPDRAADPVSTFTLAELRQLDAGSWFNQAHSEQARSAFDDEKILTLEDVAMIALGYRIRRTEGRPVPRMNGEEWTGHYEYVKDTADNGHRPGLYIETKTSGFEELLAAQLEQMGWYVGDNSRFVEVRSGKTGVANTAGRLVLQSFSRQSLVRLDSLLPAAPKCLLLWRPDMRDSLESAWHEAVIFAVANNMEFIGPSIAGPPNNYGELTAPWMTDLVHASGLYIHAYTFDTPA
ncbi:MAG TPA: hypothetical protein ENJ39_04245, partial [Flammeovirgaceae bacterium]|nr:hypothetical protein [Flammeovirgaceae bacterium]